MSVPAYSKVISGLVLFVSGGALFASDVDDLRERAEAMRSKAAHLAEQGNKDPAREVEEESTKLLETAERIEAKSNGKPENQVGFGTDGKTLKLRDRLQDLLNKERIMRDDRAHDSELMKVRGEIADIERALNKIQIQHAERDEHRPELPIIPVHHVCFAI